MAESEDNSLLEEIEYGGWKKCLRLFNDETNQEIVVTTDVGPRIIHCGFVGEGNVFKEYRNQIGGAGEIEWMIRGGHRLWHAPESRPRTYALDNGPVAVCSVGGNHISVGSTATDDVVEKRITISINGKRWKVSHTLTNRSEWPIQLAPWALTVMAPGGVAIVPLPAKRSHEEELASDFPLVMWPYTSMADDRYLWGDRYVFLRQTFDGRPTKIGLTCKERWAAYANAYSVFIKYFDFSEDGLYPDRGCNFETFTNGEMLEIESLGPLVTLQPGDHIDHLEYWALGRLPFREPTIEDSIDREIRPLVEVYWPWK